MVIAFKQICRYLEVNSMEGYDPNWPALNRAAFLIEHASVPRHVPIYCAEAGQLFAMLTAYLQQKNLSGGSDGGKK